MSHTCFVAKSPTQMSKPFSEPSWVIEMIISFHHHHILHRLPPLPHFLPVASPPPPSSSPHPGLVQRSVCMTRVASIIKTLFCPTLVKAWVCGTSYSYLLPWTRRVKNCSARDAWLMKMTSFPLQPRPISDVISNHTLQEAAVRNDSLAYQFHFLNLSFWNQSRLMEFLNL